MSDVWTWLDREKDDFAHGWAKKELEDLPAPWRAKFNEIVARMAELREPAFILASATASATSPDDLQERQNFYIGRERGVLTSALGALPGLSTEEKRLRGKPLNELKRFTQELSRPAC
jgi:hypothetical protein